jgi:ABC-type antimicrobial peptide transport system permease subunit
MAVGAKSRSIVAEFLLHTGRVVIVACIAGCGLAFALSRTLSGMVYGVSTADPFTIAAVIGTVLAIALAAALVPALRAARIDPIEALRDD